MRQARKNLYASKAIPGKKIKAEIGLARGKKKFEKKGKNKKEGHRTGDKEGYEGVRVGYCKI